MNGIEWLEVYQSAMTKAMYKGRKIGGMSFDPMSKIYIAESMCALTTMHKDKESAKKYVEDFFENWVEVVKTKPTEKIKWESICSGLVYKGSCGVFRVGHIYKGHSDEAGYGIDDFAKGSLSDTKYPSLEAATKELEDKFFGWLNEIRKV